MYTIMIMISLFNSIDCTKVIVELENANAYYVSDVYDQNLAYLVQYKCGLE